ncbi:ABC transporter E family member 2 [Tanacetum coccineum]
MEYVTIFKSENEGEFAPVTMDQLRPKNCVADMQDVWMRHGDQALKMPNGFEDVVTSEQAIEIINLPKALDKETTHRYGVNTFKLHRLPVPKLRNVVGLVGNNGTRNSTALKILSGDLIPNLGRFDNPPTWKESLKNLDHELRNYFTLIHTKKLKAIIKPQYVDDISKKANDMIVGRILEQEDERDVKAEVYAQMYMFDEPSSYLHIKQRLKVAQVIRSLLTPKRYVIVAAEMKETFKFLTSAKGFSPTPMYGLNAVKLCDDADVKKHVITKPSNTSAANNSTVDQGLSNTAVEYKCSADGVPATYESTPSYIKNQKRLPQQSLAITDIENYSAELHVQGRSIINDLGNSAIEIGQSSSACNERRFFSCILMVKLIAYAVSISDLLKKVKTSCSGEEGMLNKSLSRLLACFNWSSLDGKCRVVSSITMQTLGITQHNRHVEIFFTTKLKSFPVVGERESQKMRLIKSAFFVDKAALIIHLAVQFGTKI